MESILFPWNAVEFHGMPRHSMECHHIPRHSMEFHSIPWNATAFYGMPRHSMESMSQYSTESCLPWNLHGMPWNSTESDLWKVCYKFPRHSMESMEIMSQYSTAKLFSVDFQIFFHGTTWKGTSQYSTA